MSSCRTSKGPLGPIGCRGYLATHSENDYDKLDPKTAHSEGLGTRIYRPQPGACHFPEMLSVPGEAIYRGDVPFLLNVDHKGVQFVTPFSNFTMTMYYDF